jgi:hypothetical protein
MKPALWIHAESKDPYRTNEAESKSLRCFAEAEAFVG